VVSRADVDLSLRYQLPLMTVPLFTSLQTSFVNRDEREVSRLLGRYLDSI
jgi:hypothetical protein